MPRVCAPPPLGSKPAREGRRGATARGRGRVRFACCVHLPRASGAWNACC